MENKDNIGDFFRNYLNKSDNSDDSWDRPDAGVWVSAQTEIFTEDPVKRWSLVWLWLLAFLLMFSAVSVYIWSLKKQVVNLENTIQHQEIAIEKQEKAILNLEEKANLAEQNYSKEIESSKSEQNTILVEKEEIKKDLLGGKNSVFQLQKEKENLIKEVEIFANQLEAKNAILAEQKAEISIKKEYLKPILSLAHSTNLLAINDFIEMPDLAIAKLIQKDEIEKNKWKIGYDYSFLNLKIPASQEEKDDIKSIFNVENNVYLAPVHGLSIAYSPTKNLYIRAGIQKTEGKIERIWKISEDYDKSGEYLDAEGMLKNDLNYTFNTPYTAQDGAINVKVPEDTELEDKDNLFVQISDYQILDYKKISLGAEYLLGKGKFQWQLQAGLSWNHLSFNDYFAEAEVKVNGAILPIEKIEIKQKSDANKSFVGLYSGVGLNYNISSHWSVGANLNYNLNLINKQKNNFAVSDLLAREVGLAVRYVF
ncbi:MAG: opacity protein-like surface antigen [Saprospiraceae bacterium]|jgi:opacity protein-like surface antigen